MRQQVADALKYNVVDLMVSKLHRLPIRTQKALQQLACLGNSATFAVMSMVYQDLMQDVHDDLWDAVRTGLVFRLEGGYKFLHDRVQEAVYSLIQEGARAAFHLRIGRLLASQTAPVEIEETIFEIVNHCNNRGSHLIDTSDERERVAQLNFIAGRRAKASTAYASALAYLVASRALLTEETWGSQLRSDLHDRTAHGRVRVASAPAQWPAVGTQLFQPRRATPEPCTTSPRSRVCA